MITQRREGGPRVLVTSQIPERWGIRGIVGPLGAVQSGALSACFAY
jgi:hypothetical protein